MYYNDYLMHHGVKGMKWGVRRQQKVKARMFKAADKYDAKAARLRAKGTKRSIKRANMLSDRAKSARTYKGYSKGDGFFVNAGRNFVKEMKSSKTFYKDAASSVTKGKGMAGVKKAYNTYMNEPVNVLGYTGYQKVKRRDYDNYNYYMTY